MFIPLDAGRMFVEQVAVPAAPVVLFTEGEIVKTRRVIRDPEIVDNTINGRKGSRTYTSSRCRSQLREDDDGLARGLGSSRLQIIISNRC